jgi:hypothetical protein
MVQSSSRSTLADHESASDPTDATSSSATHCLDLNLQEREVERVLRHAWHPVARIQQLTTNSAMECRLLDEPITLVRDRGRIRGWALAPADEARAQPNRRQSRSRLAVEIWNGFVMVNRDGDALPLGPQLAPLTAHLEPYALHNRIQLDVHEVTADWDWKLSMEYFNLSMEGHRNGVLSQPLADTVEVDTDGTWSLLYGLARSRGRGHGIFPICEDLPPEYRTRINVINVFPTLHLVTDATIALWIQLHVEGPQRHLLRWSLLLPKRSVAVAKTGGRLDHYCEILRVLLEDDLQTLTRARESRKVLDTFSGRSELKFARRLRRWLSQQGSGRIE